MWVPVLLVCAKLGLHVLIRCAVLCHHRPQPLDQCVLCLARCQLVPVALDLLARLDTFVTMVSAVPLVEMLLHQMVCVLSLDKFQLVLALTMYVRLGTLVSTVNAVNVLLVYLRSFYPWKMIWEHLYVLPIYIVYSMYLH